jgi:hypothetical protein
MSVGNGLQKRLLADAKPTLAKLRRIEYYKYDFVKQTFVSEIDNSTGWFNWAFRRMPLPMLQLAGEVLYPHLS